VYDLGLEGKVALVSGSSRGVGRAVAVALARAGASVAVNYVHNDGRAASTLAEVLSFGGRAVMVRADVTDGVEAARLVQETVAQLGEVDILVNCAHGHIDRRPFPETTWDHHQQSLDGVLRGAFNLCHEVVGGMRRRGWGRVVNVGNNMVAQPVRGYSAYTSAMAAMIGFTRNLAAEAGPDGVTVNMVSPGFVMTENTPHVNELVLKAIVDTTPLRRLATPEDVAAAVVFFCSELGRFVTGADLSVDGGKVMGG